MPEEEKILKVSNLKVSFDGFTILDDINFEVAKGEALAIIGPNGAGKSILFKALLGFLPYEGKIEWAPGVKISYVPQKLEIERSLPLTVREFLGFKTENERELTRVLEAVGIKANSENEHHLEHHLLHRRLGLISGGEFQRIMIAWALIDKPNILLFDEPTSGIDVGGEQTIYNLLVKLQKETGLTILIVSHDLNIVYKYANNVLCLNKERVCFGKPDLVLKPEDLRSLYGGEAEFFKHEHAH